MISIPLNSLLVDVPLIIVTRLFHSSLCNYSLTDNYQVPRQMVRYGKEKAFEGLLSITNQFGEIQVCDLVPTKAHSQLDITLSQMQNSLILYGLREPEIFYTYNMTDKPMLEQHFPSLKESVQPITKHSLPPLFELSANVEIKVTKQASEIHDIIFRLLDDLGEDEKLVVGPDTEWNMDVNAQRAGIPDHHQTALLQIAHEHHSGKVLIIR